ncbi:MAG: sporulation protein YqfD [Bacillota bacterium]
MLKEINYFLKGYVRLNITGKSAARIINLLMRQQIELWEVRRIEGELYTNIKLNDLEQVTEYLEKVNCQFTIIEKSGLPIIIQRAINRKFIAIGIITFIIIMYGLSSFVFFIEIQGNQKLDEKELKQQLADLKVRPGVLKSSLPLEKLAEIITQKNRNIAWANLYFEGTKLVVELVEKKIIETEITPSSLIAKKSGVVTELIVLRGTPKVKEGDTVKQGEVLISENVEIIEQPAAEEEEIISKTEKVKAVGIVKAKVWYEGYGEAAVEEFFFQPTAEESENITLKYKNKEFILTGPQKAPYNYFQIKETIKRLPQWRNIDLPLEIITRKYIKLKRVKTKRTIEQAKKIAKEKAVESILQPLAKEVIIMNSNLKLISNQREKNLLRVKAVLEVEEDIAIRR